MEVVFFADDRWLPIVRLVRTFHVTCLNIVACASHLFSFFSVECVVRDILYQVILSVECRWQRHIWRKLLVFVF
jgi:hypothetical protein